MANKCSEKIHNCAFAPDIDHPRSENIVLDENAIKHIKNSKEYICLYNLKPIKWDSCYKPEEMVESEE